MLLHALDELVPPPCAKLLHLKRRELIIKLLLLSHLLGNGNMRRLGVIHWHRLIEEILRLPALVGWWSAAYTDVKIVSTSRVFGKVGRLDTVDGQISFLLVEKDLLNHFHNLIAAKKSQLRIRVFIVFQKLQSVWILTFLTSIYSHALVQHES